MKSIIDARNAVYSRIVSVEVLCRKCAVSEYHSLDLKEI